MKAKRYFITTLPVDHINGKMAQVAYKCKDIPTGGTEPDTSFWYGYRRKSSPDVSRYGIRQNHRHLETHPYTAQELEGRTTFSAAIQAVDTNLQIPTHKALCELDYTNQSEYRTLRGFATAASYHNGGAWPSQWTD